MGFELIGSATRTLSGQQTSIAASAVTKRATGIPETYAATTVPPTGRTCVSARSIPALGSLGGELPPLNRACCEQVVEMIVIHPTSALYPSVASSSNTSFFVAVNGDVTTLVLLFAFTAQCVTAICIESILV